MYTQNSKAVIHYKLYLPVSYLARFLFCIMPKKLSLYYYLDKYKIWIAPVVVFFCHEMNTSAINTQYNLGRSAGKCNYMLPGFRLFILEDFFLLFIHFTLQYLHDCVIMQRVSIQIYYLSFLYHSPLKQQFCWIWKEKIWEASFRIEFKFYFLSRIILEKLWKETLISLPILWFKVFSFNVLRMIKKMSKNFGCKPKATKIKIVLKESYASLAHDEGLFLISKQMRTLWCYELLHSLNCLKKPPKSQQIHLGYWDNLLSISDKYQNFYCFCYDCIPVLYFLSH